MAGMEPRWGFWKVRVGQSGGGSLANPVPVVSGRASQELWEIEARPGFYSFTGGLHQDPHGFQKKITQLLERRIWNHLLIPVPHLFIVCCIFHFKFCLEGPHHVPWGATPSSSSIMNSALSA